MPKKKKTRLILGIVILAVAGIAVYALTRNDPGVPVEVVEVVRGPMQTTVDEEGQTRVKTRFTIAAPVTGLLTRVDLREGDSVSPDTVVARIYPAPNSVQDIAMADARIAAAQARRREARARIDELRVRLTQLEHEVERRRPLVQSGAVSRAEMEQHQLSVASARQQLDAARASERVAQAEVVSAQASLVGASPTDGDTAPVTLTPPAEGQVLRIMEESARVVAAGTPLLVVGNPRDLEVVVDVLSTDAVQISPGAKVTFDEWGGSEPLTGSVVRIEPEAFTELSALGVEEQRVNIIASIDDIPASLGAGYRLEASIETWASDDVLQIPASALFRTESSWQVFAIRDDIVERVAVALGHRGRDVAECLEGLSDGDRIVAFPDAELSDGTRVRVSSRR